MTTKPQYKTGKYAISISPDGSKLGLMKGDMMIARIYRHGTGRVVMDTNHVAALTVKSVENVLAIMRHFETVRRKAWKKAREK